LLAIAPRQESALCDAGPASPGFVLPEKALIECANRTSLNGLHSDSALSLKIVHIENRSFALVTAELPREHRKAPLDCAPASSSRKHSGVYRELNKVFPKRRLTMHRIAAIALFAAAGLITAGNAAAQSGVIEVNVPFSFTVSSTSLPAGSYTFGFDSTRPDLLVIRDRKADLKAFDFGQRGAMSSGKPATLIFHRYGGQYFLSEVHLDSAANGIFLPATKSERRARKGSRQEDMVSLSAPRLGGASAKVFHNHLKSPVRSETKEEPALWQKPLLANDGLSRRKEAVFVAAVGTNRVRSGVMCARHSSSVACSIFRAG
jgi:hypothetical protein